MGQKTVELHEYTCDKPDCDAEDTSKFTDVPPPRWYMGVVQYADKDGDTFEAEWVACRSTHIRDAVDYSIAEVAKDDAEQQSPAGAEATA